MPRKHYWWSGIPAERYWCEITDREKPGDDLLCPQTQEGGNPYWSYSLILQIQPGDIVFHYYTPKKAFVGASVAAGVAVSDEMSWVAHGTSGRRNKYVPRVRPAWRLPITSYLAAEKPLTLAQIQKDQDWVRQWIAQKKKESSVVAAPLQPYPGKLRGYQGYLTKMPLAFVDRWKELKTLADQLSGICYMRELATELRDEDSVLAAVIEDIRQSRRQGFNISPKARRAIEDLAVDRAKRHFEAQGYAVEVFGKPFDLRCAKPGTMLHVEVKGTTTTGEEILLTPNEVRFANDHSSSMVLFIVSRIQLSGTDQPIASGGVETEIRPWRIEPGQLAPIGYTYAVRFGPDSETIASVSPVENGNKVP